jgi:hypothetical protein
MFFFVVKIFASFTVNVRIKTSIIIYLEVNQSLIHVVDKSDVKMEEKKRNFVTKVAKQKNILSMRMKMQISFHSFI